MNDQTATQHLLRPVRRERPQARAFLLSREELLAVLDSLDARPWIPGLDPDPLGELTPEGKELALTVARRALQARELMQVGDNGELLVHRALLTAVGVCAFSQSAIVAFFWPAGSDVAGRYFGHVRGSEAVAHTRPKDALHRFTLLPSKEALVDQVLDFCECSEPAIAERIEFHVSRDGFAKAREQAGAGNAPAAADTLSRGGVAPGAAGALAQTLAAPPRISVLQALKQTSDQEVRSREFTLIQDSQRAWLVMPAPRSSGSEGGIAGIVQDQAAAGEPAEGPLQVKSVTREQVRVALADGV